jgi:hypothetical protein
MQGIWDLNPARVEMSPVQIIDFLLLFEKVAGLRKLAPLWNPFFRIP